jgi:hypothetical protein
MKLTMESWLETYKPIDNHLDDNASFQDEHGVGIMFETYGAEKEFVKSQEANKIWTYISDDDSTYIVAGWHLCDRIGYFVTEKEWDDEYLSIKVS